MHCSRCLLPIGSDDQFCRKCGSAVEIIDVPAVRGEARSMRVWRDVRPAVTRGVALVAAGAVLRVLVGQAIRILSSRSAADNRSLPFLNGRSINRGSEEIEVFWYRRIRR
jgi:hypothetical protein